MEVKRKSIKFRLTRYQFESHDRKVRIILASIWLKLAERKRKIEIRTKGSVKQNNKTDTNTEIMWTKRQNLKY